MHTAKAKQSAFGMHCLALPCMLQMLCKLLLSLAMGMQHSHGSTLQAHAHAACAQRAQVQQQDCCSFGIGSCCKAGEAFRLIEEQRSKHFAETAMHTWR